MRTRTAITWAAMICLSGTLTCAALSSQLDHATADQDSTSTSTVTTDPSSAEHPLSALLQTPTPSAGPSVNDTATPTADPTPSSDPTGTDEPEQPAVVVSGVMTSSNPNTTLAANGIVIAGATYDGADPSKASVQLTLTLADGYTFSDADGKTPAATYKNADDTDQTATPEQLTIAPGNKNDNGTITTAYVTLTSNSFKQYKTSGITVSGIYKAVPAKASDTTGDTSSSTSSATPTDTASPTDSATPTDAATPGDTDDTMTAGDPVDSVVLGTVENAPDTIDLDPINGIKATVVPMRGDPTTDGDPIDIAPKGTNPGTQYAKALRLTITDPALADRQTAFGSDNWFLKNGKEARVQTISEDAQYAIALNAKAFPGVTSGSVTYIIDAHAPEISSNSASEQPVIKRNAAFSHNVTISATDLPAADNVEPSGVASLTFKGTYTDSHGSEKEIPAATGSSFTATLSDGTYDVNTITAIATDNAGNQKSETLKDILGDQLGGADKLYIDSRKDADFNNLATANIHGSTLSIETKSVAGADVAWDMLAESDDLLTYQTYDGDSASRVVKASETTGGKFIHMIALNDGKYDIADRAADILSWGAKSDRIVDTTAPTVKATDDGNILGAISQGREAKGVQVGSSSKDVLVVNGPLTFTVSGYDCYPGHSCTADDSGTSGVASGTVFVKAPTNEDGESSSDEDQTLTTVDGDLHTVKVSLNNTGIYDLDSITVTFTDKNGNPKDDAQKSQTLRQLLLEQYPQLTQLKDCSSILVLDEGYHQPTVSLSVDDNKEGNPASTYKGYYFRGGVTATFTVKDDWHKFTQALYGGTEVSSLTKGEGTDGDKPTVNDLWNAGGTYPITKSVEGHYNFTVTYPDIKSGQADAIKGAYNNNRGGSDFVLDWTAPTLGSLTLSNPGIRNGSLNVQTQPVTVTINGVTDNVSGVDDRTVAFADYGFTKLDGSEPHPESANGAISFSFSGDGQSLSLGNTSLKISDAAGNWSTTSVLSDYTGFQTTADNQVLGLTDIVVDTQAPTLSVAYDNNDVRNGKYYNAGRHMTVTLTESTFRFSRMQDPANGIVTLTRDGQPYTLRRTDFTNPSGDGKTWIAQFDCAEDGEWVSSASFTDVAGRTAAWNDDFIVDTTKPVLTLTFDNNAVRNGKYYDAARVATLTATERNFDASATASPIVTTDADAAGQSGPASSGWSDANGDQVWNATVDFAADGTYTITAHVTDLAGNVSDEVSSPEFVIDATDPTLDITNVTDKTAYADRVIPEIQATDKNADVQTLTYTLKGVRRGNVTSKLTSTNLKSDADRTQTVSYTDFPHEVEDDDVYTLEATYTDLAGNSTHKAVTFSVNRFGSTYLFEGDTSDIVGTYIKQAQDVEVSEINVSGLDTQDSSVVVSNGTTSETKTLGDGDYKKETVDDQGWSRTKYTLPASNFKDDGFYRVVLTSRDTAGNLSQNTMDNKNADRDGNAAIQFAVDGTAPVSSIAGVESGQHYIADSKDVHATSKDNLGIQTVTVSVDGVQRGQWSGDDFDPQTAVVQLAADGDVHSVTVSTIDEAGNASTATYDGIVVASSQWQYLMRHQLVLVIVSFLALAIVLAAVVVIIAALRHRRNERKRQALNA